MNLRVETDRTVELIGVAVITAIMKYFTPGIGCHACCAARESQGPMTDVHREATGCAEHSTVLSELRALSDHVWGEVTQRKVRAAAERRMQHVAS